MTSITKFETGHQDLVHSIEYDYYGKRLVTCSTDQRLKVWDFVESHDAAVWELNDDWKGHDASVIKALWAPPEFGQIIASCSFDRTVKIWEEQPVESKNSQRRWSERSRLVESKGAVLDIAFSPMHGALRLASCSVDGIIRIYEALEPTNLTQWSQMEEFDICMDKTSTSAPTNTMIPTSTLSQQEQQLEPTTSSSSSPGSQQDDTYLHDHPPQDHPTSRLPHLGNLVSPPTSLPHHHAPLRTPSSSSSGNSSTMETAQLPFGTHVPTTPGFAPPMTLPTVAPSLTMSSMDQPPMTTESQPSHLPTDIESGYCIDWCPNRTSNAMMVAGLGKEYGAKIFKHDGHNRWYPGELLYGHTNQVNDVSWAPSMGRTYQLIATACKDHFVRIFKLTQPTRGAGSRVNVLSKQASKSGGSSAPYHVEMVAEFGQHQSEVWRVKWNIMGTILSSAGNDGTIRLWRTGYDGIWREMATVNTSSQHKSPSTH